MQAMVADQPRRWSPAESRPGSARNTDLFPRDEYYLNNRLSGAY